MRADYGVSSFVRDSGERFCLIMDRSTMLPVFYPNLFLTTQVRNSNANSFSTVHAVASNLVVLLRFLDRNDIDLEKRIIDRHFLTSYELDSLRDFTQIRFLQKEVESSVLDFLDIEEIELSQKPVNTATQYVRLTTIAEYLYWFSELLIDQPTEIESEKIQKLLINVKARRPKRKNRNNATPKSLDKVQVNALLAVIEADSELNPFSPELQVRNRLIILILLHLGIRGGELLNLKVKDIDFSSNVLRVVRRADDPDDPRVNEPNVKTIERKIPLKDYLAKAIHDYIVMERREVIKSLPKRFKDSGHLFITHKPGPTLGKPISKSGYHKIIYVIKSVTPELYKLCAHKLRHTWNDSFSEFLDSAENPKSPEEQEQIRTYLMGWAPGSGTAATYNKRFIQNKAFEAALALQENSGTRLPEKGLK